MQEDSFRFLGRSLLCSVGVFSCYADHLRQGWGLLQDFDQPSERLDGDRQPRSFARITDDRLTAMIADYKAGLSGYEIAAKYGHHRTTVMKHLAKSGIRSRVAAPTDEEIAAWLRLHAQGLGFKAIARRVNRNHKTIRKHVNRSTSLDLVERPSELLLEPATEAKGSVPKYDINGQI